jgi:acetyl esterase
MPLDPQAQHIIDLVKQANAPEYWQLTPDQAREQYRLRVDKLKVREPIHRTEDRRIPGPGSHLPIRIYHPRDPRPGEKLPVLMWYHGGGFVIGDLETHDSICRILANQADCLVVAVNLATVVAMLARDAGYPRLAFQLLIYPTTAPEPETPSHRSFAQGYLLTRNTIVWFYKHYLRTPRDAQDFRFAPLVADDLSNLPPAFVLVAGYDPLRDEGVDYAKRLIEAGNRVRLANYEGLIHGFCLMGGAVDAAKRAVAESAQLLREALNPPR